MKREKRPRLTALDIEISVANYFDWRRNLIVPNISHGLFRYELDLFVLTPKGYAWEIEIKTTRSDLIRDQDKRHGHQDWSNRIRLLYFALPDYLYRCHDLVPERAGIIEVRSVLEEYEEFYLCKIVRNPKVLSNYKWSDIERYKVARLGALRIWGLKEKLRRNRNGDRNRNRRRPRHRLQLDIPLLGKRW